MLGRRPGARLDPAQVGHLPPGPGRNPGVHPVASAGHLSHAAALPANWLKSEEECRRLAGRRMGDLGGLGGAVPARAFPGASGTRAAMPS